MLSMSVGDLPLWLTEDMTWPLLWGLLLIGIFGFVWFVTQKFRFLAIALAMVCLLIAVAVVEMKYVTDREYLVESVYEMTEHVRNNNPDGILQFVRDDNTEFAERIRSRMSQYRVEGCQLIGFREVTVDPTDTPRRKAVVAFSVLGSGSMVGYSDKIQQVPVAVELEFEQIAGKWSIEAYGYRAANSTAEINMIRH